MTKNSILLDTLEGKTRERPPIWFMRQAGRVLPSYMEMRESFTFKELLSDPELASKVTLLPINDLDVDAAILFSDILVIPEALGMNLTFTSNGPMFERSLKHVNEPANELSAKPEKLEYIYATIEKILEDKPTHIPLIGFCGAPFTTICFMLEGGAFGHNFNDILKFLYKYPGKTKNLLEKVTELSVFYAQQQVQQGIDVFQLFDTHAGQIPLEMYFETMMPYNERILSAVREKGTPAIFFPKGIGSGFSRINKDTADVLSIDWQESLHGLRNKVGNELILQGNLDPRVLLADRENIAKTLDQYIKFGKDDEKWIFNLGHGFLANTPYENAKFTVDYMKKSF